MWWQKLIFDLNEKFRIYVKLGDNSKMLVKGKWSIKLKIDDVVQIIYGVYYIPYLKNNLLSIGQLQEKYLTIVSKQNICKDFIQKEDWSFCPICHQIECLWLWLKWFFLHASLVVDYQRCEYVVA